MLRRREDVDGFEVVVASHRLTPERFSARVHNVEAGTVIGRGSGPTREAAEERALEGARLVLELHAARMSLQRGISALEPFKGDRDQ